MPKTVLAKLVDGLISQLMEHCDTVQVFATKYDPETDQTSTFVMGKGNALARLKQAEDWVIAMDDRETVTECESED